MALIEEPSEEDWAVLSIVTDPVLFGEFCRNTIDGSPYKEEWPNTRFKYRWYQKDLLSDKNEFIVLTGGRQIGKCSPMFARVLVHPYGYLTIRDIFSQQKKKKLTAIYTIDDSKRLTQRRLRIGANGYREIFRITTAQGHIFEGTANHPILTPTGYENIEHLHLGNEVGITTFLPHDSKQNLFSWEELRWFGYVSARYKVSPEAPIRVKFQRNVLELQRIAEYFDANIIRNADGTYSLVRKRGPYKHYMTHVLSQMGLTHANIHGLVRVPFDLKSERLENIKIFLESFLSTWATFSEDVKLVSIQHNAKTFALDIQELMLRFGIESKVSQGAEDVWNITIDDYAQIYKLVTTLDIPGISTAKLKLPAQLQQPTPYMRWDYITDITSIGVKATFAIHVPDTHNYISDNLLVHNSIVLEDKMVYEAVNAEQEFPNQTKESVLVTPNTAQMTRVLDSKISRFSNSPLLKDFLKGNINRTKGTMEFPLGSTSYKFFSRIAGTKGENNMVSLHATKLKGDEMQIFPMASFIQLGPCYNSWDTNCSQLFTGVHNGLREGSVLYYLDQKASEFKKYRIPAHENPYYFLKTHIADIIKYGGVDSDDYIHLVLGLPGDPSFSIIPRDKIVTEPYDFYSYRYTQTDKHNGRTYQQVLQLHDIPASKRQACILSLDTGWADPTVAHVMGMDANGVWRTFARYRLTRIEFPEQANIIDWLDNFYNFNLICIDHGSGGGGIGISQDLTGARFPKQKQYLKRVHGVQFGGFIENGEDSDGNLLKTRSKSFAGIELARRITEGNIIFSEVDQEGLSQMERVAYQRQADGTNKYFILADDGKGKSKDDHIFASYVVFILTLLTRMMEKPKKRLFSTSWIK